MLIEILLSILLVALVVITVAVAVLVCYEGRRFISDFRDERKERARLQAAAKYPTAF